MVGYGLWVFGRAEAGRNRKNKKPDSDGVGLGGGSTASFSRGAYFQRMTIVAKPTRASVRV
jgi:hypothetical protein